LFLNLINGLSGVGGSEERRAYKNHGIRERELCQGREPLESESVRWGVTLEKVWDEKRGR